MENKKAILFYCEWIENFESLSDTEAGILIKHLLRYVNDQNPEYPDRITELSFLPIKQCLKRDLVKWERRAEISRINGMKGGRKNPKEPNKTQRTQQVILEPKEPDKVKVKVKDKDNVKVKDNVNKTIKEEIIIDKSISLYPQFNELYFQFYQNRVGIKPIFNSVDGKSLKSIIKYLTEISNNNDPAAAWKYILDNIDKWDSFYQDQLKLNQIYSNLPNILNNIKNGISKNKPIDKQAERIKQDLATVARLTEKYEREGIDLT